MDLADKISEWRDDPVKFCRDCFTEPVDWQKEALKELSEYNDIAIKAGRWTGKSTYLVWTQFWFLATHPEAKIVCTAPKQDQLKDNIIGNASLWLRRSPLSEFFETTGEKIQLKEAPDIHFATMQTASDPENIQGYNAENVMIVMDESSGIDRDIVEAVRGSLFGNDPIWIMAGNPTRVSGPFYDIWDSDYGNFSKYTIDSRDCELANDEKIAQFEEDYPESHPRHDMYVKGEFPEKTEDTFIQPHLVERGVENEEKIIGSTIEMGVDASRTGDNKTVVTARMGPKVIDISEFDGNDLSKAKVFILRRMRNLRKKMAQRLSQPSDEIEVIIRVDSAGLGGGLADELASQLEDDRYATIVDINPGEKPFDDEDAEVYKDAATASWASIRERLQGDDVNIDIPDNPELISQLTQREFKILPSGKEKLEPKTKMEEKSPDHADSLAYCFYPKGSDMKTYQDVEPEFYDFGNRFRMKKHH